MVSIFSLFRKVGLFGYRYTLESPKLKRRASNSPCQDACCIFFASGDESSASPPRGRGLADRVEIV